ncbi:Glycosyl hydrolases family 43 [Rhizoctonia solani]|uniref:arabinan endo-1,5-alpha-L-arabinosidase n=1 Tax=Rhizoctonia solani TaxID=456999 RepID=A0A8H7GZX8_9AGAM|nr:Glycosyl hydrolases family 43 [Rhizoctonia solani]
MRLTLSSITLSALSLVGYVLAAYPNPGKVTGSIDVHDPSICRDSAGKYFLFSTAPGIAVRTSTDRTNWSYVGTVWSKGQATWTDKYTSTTGGNGNLCAVWEQLYYAASSFGSRNSAIFFATSTTGLPNSWTNQGLVLSTTNSDDYNAIDPSLIIDGNNWWLTFGSFWSGIKLVPLGSSTGKPSGSTIYSLAKRTAGGGAVEAPMLIKNGNYYYLFTSWDKCCDGTSSTYNIRIGRSTSITGPYVDESGVALMSGGGTEILGLHGSIIGPGGQSVFKDTDGWVIDYHYYTSTGSLLGINLLNFASGWPVVD